MGWLYDKNMSVEMKEKGSEETNGRAKGRRWSSSSGSTSGPAKKRASDAIGMGGWQRRASSFQKERIGDPSSQRRSSLDVAPSRRMTGGGGEVELGKWKCSTAHVGRLSSLSCL